MPEPSEEPRRRPVAVPGSVGATSGHLRTVLLGALASVVLVLVGAGDAWAQDPPWSPTGYELDNDEAYEIEAERRCDVGHQWTWITEDSAVGLILVPCDDAVAASAAANAQVLFSGSFPDERAIEVDHVSWSPSDGIALRVWTQGETIVVLAVGVQDDDRDRAFAIGADLAPELAAALPGVPAAPANDGQAVQGLLIAAPIAVWLLFVLPARGVVALARPRYRATSTEPRWQDVTWATRVLVRHRRLRRLARWLLGLGVVLLGFGVLNLVGGFGWLDSLLRMLVGAGMVAGGVVVLRRHPRHAIERADRPPSTRGTSAILGTALSALAYALAIALLAATAFAAVASSVLPPGDPDWGVLLELLRSGVDTPRVLLIVLAAAVRTAFLPTLAVVVALLVLIAGLDALGRRLRAASLREVVERDPRSPILYLRSFDEDRLTLPATLHRRGLMDTLNVVRRRRFEEAMVVQLQRFGPVVAIAPPGSGIPAIGAARASYGHDEWQDRVTELAQRAAVVVLSATPDSVREGFGWEIDLVAGRLGHTRVMVVVGPWRSQLTRRWEAFRAYIAQRPFFADLASADLPDGLLVAARTRAWGWRAWGAERRTDVTYAVALDHAMHALAGELEGVDDDPDAVDPLLAELDRT